MQTHAPGGRNPDVVIVGGGIIGVTTACFAAEAGLSVVLLERDGLAAAASGRNQGLVIGPHPIEMAAIAARGVEHYLDLHESSGKAFCFDRAPHGCLLVGGDTVTDETPSEVLEGAALRAVEPLLGPSIGSATLLQDARRIDPGAAVASWAVRARQAGVDVRTGVDVKELLQHGDRVTGVSTDDGVISAGTVVVAAGPWSWRVCRSTTFDVPVNGVRGWIVMTRPAPFRLRHAVEESFWGAVKKGLAVPTVQDLAEGTRPAPLLAGLLQQDHRGRLLLGASLQISPTDHPEQQEVLAAVCERAATLVPAVRSLQIVEIRTCRRPMSSDGLPLHGPVPGVEGLVLACGHGSQGITWGPGSGEAVAHGLSTGAWLPELLPSRFSAEV